MQWTEGRGRRGEGGGGWRGSGGRGGGEGWFWGKGFRIIVVGGGTLKYRGR